MVFRDTLPALRALGDEGRLRALLAVQQQELCVCQITELLSLAPSTVSKHMTILKQANLVESRKEGRWMYYRMSLKHASASVANLMEGLLNGLAAHPDAARDAKRLAEIVAMDPEELCRRQCRLVATGKGAREAAVGCC